MIDIDDKIHCNGLECEIYAMNEVYEREVEELKRDYIILEMKIEETEEKYKEMCWRKKKIKETYSNLRKSYHALKAENDRLIEKLNRINKISGE